MERAFAMRQRALDAGDQAYGAIVVRDGRIVGEAPSRVVTARDPTAHAEMEAIRDAARRLGTVSLVGLHDVLLVAAVSDVPGGRVLGGRWPASITGPAARTGGRRSGAGLLGLAGRPSGASPALLLAFCCAGPYIGENS